MDMGLDLFTSTKLKSCNTKICLANVRRKPKCEQVFTKPNLGFSYPIISLLLHFLLLGTFVCPIYSLKTSNHQLVNQTFQSAEKLHKLKKKIAMHLRQINKSAVKTIQSPDGDIIDCVLTHKQLAFDHPQLKGQKPLDPPERPRGYNQMSNLSDNFQLWSLSGESCPDGTIPIRRITEQDLLRYGSISGFGSKFTKDKHQYAVTNVEGGGFYGAQATINVWAPYVENPNEFSLAQMWITSGSYDKEDLNTIEVGWEICPLVFGDNRTRFFIYWTADAYQDTGCINLNCPGFVQTNKNVVIGGSLTPSTYDGNQVTIPLTIWSWNGNWWLELGTGNYLGYWPSSIFTNLKDVAEKVYWGGEIVNLKFPQATSTQMGSGHLPSEGFRKAAYIKNMEVLYSNGKPIPMPESKFTYNVEKPNCYAMQVGHDQEWGNYIYFGGPGRNEYCP